ncbi:unnamed protein product [Psylliodes chrysocephalus]|uniref:Glutaredoxin 3 n=1 Tax=Psylliodes chrysocephalus TaxID=3402493 RepID=A0A9P0CLJ3_9CUCU|nr:unnamed protein product [Psylliodes chrysocephala]
MVTLLKTQTAFEDAIKAPVISVVHFQAEWADQCIHINQLLEALSSQSNYSNLKFYSCPAEELSEVSAKYNIEAVPTLILFRSGKSLEVIHGANTEKITEILQKYNGLSVGDQNIPLNERLKALINKGKVMLFMKGDRNVPRCGFSKQIIAILNDISIPYETFDILSDEEVRQGLKTYSNWPTYPQLYVKGELIGGLDIIKEMLESGELLATLKD